jgi:PAS domain S-box-containing protein
MNELSLAHLKYSYSDLKTELQQIQSSLAAITKNDSAKIELEQVKEKLDSMVSKIENNLARSPQISNFFDQIPDMISYWNKDLINVYSNKAYSDYFGFGPEQIQNQHISNLLGDELYKKNLKCIEGVLKGELQSFERELPTPCHGKRMTRVTYIPNSYNNEVIGFFVKTTDINPYARIEEDLQHIFHQTRDLMCIASTDGTFKRISPSFERILGFSEVDLVGKPFLDFIHHEDLDKTKKCVEELSTGQPVIHFENRYKTKDGDYRLISWVCEPDVKTGLLYASGRDVTELRTVESRNSAILDTIDKTAIVSFADSNGIIIGANDNFCKISGYRRDELLGQDHSIVNSGFKSNSFVKNLSDILEGNEIWIGNLTNKKKDGSLYNVRAAIAPIRNIKGIIEQYISIRFDITEQTKLKSQLVEAQSIAKIGSWHLDLQTNLQNWTSEHYKIFEIEEPQAQEDLFRLYRERIHPNDLPQLDIYIDRALKFNEDFVYPHRVNLDNGNRIKFVRGIGKVTKSASGEAVSISGTCQDITEIVELQEQNKFILDSTGLGIWKFNPISKELNWDESMYRLFEIKKEDFSGDYHAWENALKPTHKEKAINDLQLAIKEKTEYQSLLEILTPSGQTKYIGARATIVRDENNNAIMMYGINWDQTKDVLLEKKIEKERALSIHTAKMASLGEMSASIAHEINNPLAIIYGLIPLLTKFKSVPEKFNEKLESINRAANRINKIVLGLKKFSRSHDYQVLKPESLNDIIDEVIALTEPKSKGHSTPIKLDVEDGLTINCDVVEIEQVLINLINNGIDALKNKEVRWLEINAKKEGSEIILKIIDSGLGISKEDEAKLFEPFYTTKPIGEGTGLGLSISKGILDQHNATICIDRTIQNTCFKICFPSAETIQLVS